MNENRYSYLVGSWRRPSNSVYVAETPESAVERHAQELFLTGQTHLQHEEYTLALNAFQEVMSYILYQVHPTMPINWNPLLNFRFPNDITLVDALVAKSAESMQKTPPPKYLLPTSLVSERSVLTAQTQQALKSATTIGLQVTSFQAPVQEAVSSALEAASRKDWPAAIKLYETALGTVPATELTIQGGLQHDLAILNEKADNRSKALELGQTSIRTFEAAKATDAQAQAIATTAGLFNRGGNAQQAGDLTKQLDKIRTLNNFNRVVTTATVAVDDAPSFRAISAAGASRFSAVGDARLSLLSAPMVVTPQEFTFNQNAPELMGLKFLADSVPQKAMTISGLTDTVSIVLDQSAVANTKSFLTTLSATKDIGLLTNWMTPLQFVAYIPHMYFYIIPMSIGDCHAGMGNLEQARQSYAGVLSYPFINKNYEIIKVWTRLAQTMLDLGDQAYRNARDTVAGFGMAKGFYEAIVLTNRTLNATSPLYASAKFADLKTRITTFLAADDPLSVAENPAITTIVLDALGKLQQIAAGLNFFGFGLDYVPPFSFEYLQNTARYFAQQASQTEQRYIQYKSQGENEEFKREQLDQQAQVAAQTVVLEQRGVAEAQRGIDVANAGLNYASVQTQNAIDSKTDFDNVRWELLELSEAEAWANASSVDRDDQVKLTWNGNYYNSDKKRRNVVIKELAYQRTRISHDLEANKLDRAIASAQAYQAVAQAQIAQAQARQAVARQRVVIAQLQQRQAEENRDFLDMREFGARLWYELAQQAKRIKQRYLDMATEIAFLMERAYNAETERGLQAIRYDYQQTNSGNLMGADLLLADIDSFTFDHVTTTKTKKIPIKKTISLADQYAMSFQALKTTGRCMFETALADFDREHPGFYLAKIRNVELIFVGITGATSIAGTFRNIGVSRFRSSAGNVVERMYPADVMALSQYEIRQDALAFRFNPNDLRLFENNGIDTLWQLDLPLAANDFDYNEILDVHLILYYDGFFDPTLETQINAILPTTGSASRAFSLKLSFPDELFFLKNQGEAELTIDATMFPRNQKDLVRTTTVLKLSGNPATVANRTLRLTSGAVGGELMLTTDANGEVADAALASLTNKPMLDTWTIRITGDDNPDLVQNNVLNLSGLSDVLIFSEYTFTYR